MADQIFMRYGVTVKRISKMTDVLIGSGVVTWGADWHLEELELVKHALDQTAFVLGQGNLDDGAAIFREQIAVLPVIGHLAIIKGRAGWLGNAAGVTTGNVITISASDLTDFRSKPILTQTQLDLGFRSARLAYANDIIRTVIHEIGHVILHREDVSAGFMEATGGSCGLICSNRFGLRGYNWGTEPPVDELGRETVYEDFATSWDHFVNPHPDQPLSQHPIRARFFVDRLLIPWRQGGRRSLFTQDDFSLAYQCASIQTSQVEQC